MPHTHHPQIIEDGDICIDNDDAPAMRLTLLQSAVVPFTGRDSTIMSAGPAVADSAYTGVSQENLQEFLDESYAKFCAAREAESEAVDAGEDEAGEVDAAEEGVDAATTAMAGLLAGDEGDASMADLD